MGGMTAIASLLDAVAAFTESGPDFLRDAEILSLNPHSLKPYRMAAFPEFLQLISMALTTLFWKDHGLLFGRSLVIDVAGDAMDPVPRMFRFNPGLKEARGPFLVTGDTKPHVDLLRFLRSRGAHGERRGKNKER